MRGLRDLMRNIIVCASFSFPDAAMSRLARAIAFAVVATAAVPVLAADDEFRIAIQDHKFEPAEVVVPAGKKLKLVIENRDSTPEEFESHALSREKVIAGKSTATIVIGPLKAGRYPFVGEYHEKTAQGVIVVR
jgi:plastocyanin